MAAPRIIDLPAVTAIDAPTDDASSNFNKINQNSRRFGERHPACRCNPSRSDQTVRPDSKLKKPPAR